MARLTPNQQAVTNVGSKLICITYILYWLKATTCLVLSSIYHSYCVCGDFNIHVDVPGGDGGKFLSQIDATL